MEEGEAQTLHLTALLRKSDSFRSPKSRKLDPGNSLSAGKGSKTASITAGSGDPPNGWASPHSRAAARPAQSSGPSVGKRAGWEGGAGRSRAKPRGRGGQRPRGPGSGARGARRPLGQRRRAGCAQGPRAHRGHLADSSSAGSCRGTAGFHGEPGSGAEGLRSPPDRVGAGGGGAERSPLRLGGCRALRSLCVSLCTASVTFPLCEAGNPGLVSPAGRGATPPTSIFTIISY